MNPLVEIIVFSYFAGVTIFIGGLAAWVFESHIGRSVKSYIIHWSVAFGGGILIAAVGFVLAPKGIDTFSVPVFGAIFLSGAFAFFLLDQKIGKSGGILAQTMAMLMDFIPEVIALGAVFAHEHRLGILLAFFIGLQNIPESFNAYFDLRKSGNSPKGILSLFFFLSSWGVVFALAGRYFLSGRVMITNGIMLFAAGGILYLIFQDIAPSSKLRNHWEPALGAVFGFLVGMIGTKMFG